MRRSFTLIVPIILLGSAVSFGQGMSVNTTGAPAATSAMLDVSSSTQGVLVPRMSQSDRDLISTPATGLLIYQNDGTTGFYVYNGTAWTAVGAAGPAGSAGPVGPPGPPGATGTISAQGTYSAAVTYSQNQVVFSGGSSYVSLVNANLNNTPSSSPAFWSLLAAQGSAGSPGSNGAAGAGFSNGSASGQIYLTGATPFAPQIPVTVTGDVTIVSSGITSIGNAAGNHIATALGLASAGTTGVGNVVLATFPTLISPALGTPSALVGTNITGTAANLTAGDVGTSATAGNHMVSAINAGTGGINVSQLSASGTFPAENGSALTALNATQLTSGTIPVPRLASSGTASAATFLNGAGAWATPTGTLTSYISSFRTTATSTTIVPGDDVLYQTGGSALTFTLPAASSVIAGKIFYIIGQSATNIIATTLGSSNMIFGKDFNGVTSTGAVVSGCGLVSDGSRWFMIFSN